MGFALLEVSSRREFVRIGGHDTTTADRGQIQEQSSNVAIVPHSGQRGGPTAAANVSCGAIGAAGVEQGSFGGLHSGWRMSDVRIFRTRGPFVVVSAVRFLSATGNLSIARSDARIGNVSWAEIVV
jgi:hypothetical protein